MVVDAFRHKEFLVFRPAVVSLREPDFLLAERFTVSTTSILLMGRAVSDVAVHDDERGAILGVMKSAERTGQHVEVVCVSNSRHVPAVTDKTRGHVFRKRQGSVAFDRDVVVVVDPAEIRKSQVSSERCRLAGDAFHHASIPAKRVNVEVEQVLEAWAVITRRQPLPADGNADAGGDTLAERARGGLDARRPAVLGMSRTAAV